MSAHSGPNIVENGLVLCLDAANEKSFAPYNNILNTSAWTIGSGSVTGFGLNGSTTENYRVFDTDPWGQTNIVWEARPDATSGADGGWNGSQFAIDKTKMYRFSVWVRRTVTGNGSFYLGTRAYGSTNGVTRRITGVSTTNPYFWSGGIAAGDWRLVVGHVWPAGSGIGDNHPDSGQYTIQSGRIANISHDYVWRDQTTTSLHRSYLYYSTNTSTRQQWIYPRVDIIDGTEPSIQDLLDNKPYVSYDLSGISNNGSLLNNVSFNDANNGSFVFDGVDDYIDLGNASSFLFGNSNITFSFWIKLPISYLTSYPVIISKGTYNTNGGFLFYIVDNKLRAHVDAFPDAGQSTRFEGNSTINDNIWHMCIFILKNNEFFFYIDGELDNSRVYSPTSEINVNSTLPVTIGKRTDGEHFPGNISSVQIYNRALTEQEIKQNFNALRGRYGI